MASSMAPSSISASHASRSPSSCYSGGGGGGGGGGDRAQAQAQGQNRRGRQRQDAGCGVKKLAKLATAQQSQDHLPPKEVRKHGPHVDKKLRQGKARQGGHQINKSWCSSPSCLPIYHLPIQPWTTVPRVTGESTNQIMARKGGSHFQIFPPFRCAVTRRDDTTRTMAKSNPSIWSMLEKHCSAFCYPSYMVNQTRHIES